MGMNSFSGINSTLTLVISVSLLFQKNIRTQERETEEVNSFTVSFFDASVLHQNLLGTTEKLLMHL